MKKLGIICFLSLIVVSLSFCRKDVNGPIDEIPDPPAERTIDWVIQNRPQDLLAVIAEFPDDEIIPGKTSRKIVLIDYYNPKTYKIVSDTTYRPFFISFSPDKKKIIFGDSKYYIADAGPTFVLYDLEENTFLRIDDPYDPLPDEFFLPGIFPVWNYYGTGFYYSQEPAWVQTYGQNLFYFDLLTNHVTHVAGRNRYRTYAVDIVGPDTLIVFSNDSLSTGQPEGFYYMSTEGEFLSRINIETSLHQRPYGGTDVFPIEWNESIQMFIITEAIAGGLGPRIAICNRDYSFYKSINLRGVHHISFIGVTPEKNLMIMEYSENSLGNNILKLNYETGIYQDFFSADMIPSCTGFWFWMGSDF